jgi:hypothetical protein
MDANTAVENVQAPLMPAKKRGRPAKVVAPVTAAPVKVAAEVKTRKPRKSADPVARVHRAIMRDYLTKATQAYLYGHVAAGDAWIAEAKTRRAILDKIVN